MSEPPLLQVEELRTVFRSDGVISRAVDGVSLTVDAGETVAIVGESGSGKSVTSLSIMRLVPIPPGEIADGRVLFRGRDLLRLSEADMRQIRGNDISMIFQEPMSSLNPLLTVGEQIAEVVRLHQGLGRSVARRHAIEMLQRVSIPDPELRSRGVSASAVGRHAPAGDDRHGVGVPSIAADRGRADDGPGCHDPGTDPAAHSHAAGGDGDERPVHHP